MPLRPNASTPQCLYASMPTPLMPYTSMPYTLDPKYPTPLCLHQNIPYTPTPHALQQIYRCILIPTPRTTETPTPALDIYFHGAHLPNSKTIA
jgi:hypothetical protein